MDVRFSRFVTALYLNFFRFVNVFHLNFMDSSFFLDYKSWLDLEVCHQDNITIGTWDHVLYATLFLSCNKTIMQIKIIYNIIFYMISTCKKCYYSFNLNKNLYCHVHFFYHGTLVNIILFLFFFIGGGGYHKHDIFQFLSLYLNSVLYIFICINYECFCTSNDMPVTCCQPIVGRQILMDNCYRTNTVEWYNSAEKVISYRSEKKGTNLIKKLYLNGSGN